MGPGLDSNFGMNNIYYSYITPGAIHQSRRYEALSNHDYISGCNSITLDASRAFLIKLREQMCPRLVISTQLLRPSII